LEWEDQRKQLLETIDGTALKSILDPIRPLMLISFLLAPCSPRCRTQSAEDAGGATGRQGERPRRRAGGASCCGGAPR
jgi:hypothetical protein